MACRKDKYTEALCMDFAKNLPLPNISTNDVYYKRQLSVYSFTIHVLSTSQCIFYTYPEIIGRKGSDDVCSLLHHYIYNYLDPNVRKLQIFCDSCGGQNKNFTVLRFIHNIVHNEKKLDSIQITFPIRGHSYMECDKDFGLVNQKTKAELPQDWAEEFRTARHKPSPFNVEEVSQDYFRAWTEFLGKRYRNKCPFLIRPIREIKAVTDHPRLLYYRTSFSGSWESAVITKNSNLSTFSKLPMNHFELPPHAYSGKSFTVSQPCSF